MRRAARPPGTTDRTPPPRRLPAAPGLATERNAAHHAGLTLDTQRSCYLVQGSAIGEHVVVDQNPLRACSVWLGHLERRAQLRLADLPASRVRLAHERLGRAGFHNGRIVMRIEWPQPPRRQLL